MMSAVLEGIGFVALCGGAGVCLYLAAERWFR